MDFQRTTEELHDGLAGVQGTVRVLEDELDGRPPDYQAARGLVIVVAGAHGQAIAELGTRGPPTEGPLVDVDRAERGRAPAPTVEASS
jgi:hypothetical protein